MKKISCFFFALAIILSSCDTKEQKLGDFRLLPQPQEFQITYVSPFYYDSILNYEAVNGEKLPVRTSDVLGLKEGSQGNSQLRYQIDTNMEIPTEGYTLAIAEESINIT